MTRRLAVVVGLVLVALVLADAVLLWGARGAGGREQARTDALGSASSRLPQLLGYDYTTFAHDRRVALAQTTGGFREEYAALLDKTVAPTAAAKRIHTSAKVTGAGVVGSSGKDVVVLVFLTQTTTAPGAQAQVTASRVDVTMTHTSHGWLISQVQPV